MLLLIIFLLFCFLFLVLYLYSDKRNVYKDLNGKHVVVTGGSSGIGKAAATEAVRLGAHVTIIGRDNAKLEEAVTEISKHASMDQKIKFASLDVTSDYSIIEKCFTAIEADSGPIFMLITCAGTCVCGQFENMKVNDIRKMIDLNYFGTALPTRYVLPGMKARNQGIIVFVSSEASLIGIYGYSAYSAGKWAVRGLAEALFMELVGTNVQLTLAFPPDTDTPGFKEEELTKPKETKQISSSAGLVSADDVGKKLVHDALNGRLYSVCSFSGKMMSLLSCGSIESASQVMLQVMSMGILRVIMVFVMFSFHKIVRDGLKMNKNNESKKIN